MKQKIFFNKIIKYLLLLMIILIVYTSIEAQQQSNKTIIIGGSYDYPPYSYLDEKGLPSGFSVEISRALSNIINAEIILNLEAWGDVRKNLKNKKNDLIHDIVYSEERAKLYEFSNPYYISYYTVFEKKDGKSINDFTDLENKRIVLIRGDIGHDYIIEQNINAYIHLVDDYADAILLLEKGNFDFTMMDKLAGLYWIKNLGAENVSLSEVSLFNLRYCFATQKDNRELIMKINGALNILQKSGQYEEIYEMWMSKINPWYFSTDKLYKYLLRIIIPILGLVLILIIWTWTLNKKVKDKTKELNKNITELKQTKETLQSINEKLENSNKEIVIKNIELKEANEKLTEALDDKAVLLYEIHHRVKNNLLLIQSMLSIQQIYLADTDAIKILEECKNRINSISLIHESLYQNKNFSKIEMKTYINNLILNIKSAFAKDTCPIKFNTYIHDIVLTIDKAIPIGLIINETLTNSYKHAFNNYKKGIIDISFKRNEDKYILLIKDNGNGLSENIDITKEAKSCGLKLISLLVRQLAGNIDIKTNEGFKTVLTINANLK